MVIISYCYYHMIFTVLEEAHDRFCFQNRTDNKLYRCTEPFTIRLMDVETRMNYSHAAIVVICFTLN